MITKCKSPGKLLMASMAHILLHFCFLNDSQAACTGSSPNWTSTPDYASVNNCVSMAAPNDTIQVTAGSAIWSSTLSITKGISLIGAGSGNTVISGTYLISIVSPNNSSLLRISGFTFSGTSGTLIDCDNNYSDPASYNIRIDHNHFTGVNDTTPGSAIHNGGCRGVADNNVVDSKTYPFRVGHGDGPAGDWDWLHFPQLVFGLNNDNFYLEDNTITGATSTISDGDKGGRYVFRYNSITADLYPFFDMHGGKGTVYGFMGGEIYGNQLNGSGNLLSDQGAGRAAVHHNNLTGGGQVVNYVHVTCPSGGKPTYDGGSIITEQEMNNTYEFLNRQGLAGSLIPVNNGGDICGGVIVENSTYWKDNTSCIAPSLCSNITSGVGCGTLANLPANCTTGTGFWVTNQSCTDLTGSVGVNPANPISGTLYKCTSTNQWTAFYKPLAYPHPLRQASAQVPAILLAAPQNLRTIM
ncbi:MAG: hypothetical protein ACXVB1_04035 [Pseudobdellovibrionaceae bacterium]